MINLPGGIDMRQWAKGSQDMVASIIRTIFAQPDKEHA